MGHICTTERSDEYLPMSSNDVALFYDIPLFIRVYKIQSKDQDKYTFKFSFKGIRRKEDISIDLLKWDGSCPYQYYFDNVNNIVQDFCAKKWPLDSSFGYEYNFARNTLKLEVPIKLGNFTPDWQAIYFAIMYALRSDSDIDNLFMSYYNEILETSVYEFRIKHKRKCRTSTDKLLDINDLPENVKRFVLRVTAKIERETGNTRINSFDFARVRISIPTEGTFPNRKEFIKDNMKWLVTVAMNKLDNLKSFNRFGIPTNCLSLKKATITSSSELELLFELKDELRNMNFETKG